MSILKTSNIIVLILLCSVSFLFSCSEDDTIEIEEKVEGYVVALRATDGDASADYLMTHDDLMTGVISASGQGIEQAGWSYYTAAGGKYFSIGYTLNEVQSYIVEKGVLAYEDKLIYDRLDLLGEADDHHFIGIGAPWGGGSYDCQIQLINTNEVLIERNVAHPIYESYDDQGVQLNAWPTGCYVEGDKLYVSLYTLYGDTWVTPHTDEAIVCVFSYPEFEYISTFKDDRAGPVGYYSSQPVILENENGDHYTISSSSLMAGFTQCTKPSAILKINAGEQKFDDDYYFNLEEFGYKVLSGKYVGNNKVVAKVVSKTTDETLDAAWGAFGNYSIMEVAVIDLEQKTFEIVEDVPVHKGQYLTPYYLEDGKVYMTVTTDDDAYIYQVDPQTATAQKGAQIEGIDLQAIYKH